MAKVECVVCGKTLGYTIGIGFHNNTGEYVKTKDGKWACSQKCARDYNLQLLSSSKVNNNDSLSEREVETDPIKEAALELEKEKLEFEKKKNRQNKAAQLRSQGKKTQAFFVEYIFPIFD